MPSSALEKYNISAFLSVYSDHCELWFVLQFFHLPMALAVPPSVHLVHQQFNLLYQFWIHTEVVETLGPLEWILNTPSHHRVHHGTNPYCIDKNYGIWTPL